MNAKYWREWASFWYCSRELKNIGENELLFDIAHAENSPHVNVVQIFTNVLDNKLFWNFERAIA